MGEAGVSGEAIGAHGFAIFDDLFEPHEVDRLLETFARWPLQRGRAGARHALRHPAVAGLARDPRLLRIARGVLGPAALPFRATLFDKSPFSNWLVVWHQDTALPVRRRLAVPGWGPWSRKGGVVYAHAPTGVLSRMLALRVHLDDSTQENGPLRVLPGTHQRGVMADEEVQTPGSCMPLLHCLVSRGGVLAMRPLLVHASSKSRADAPRRVLHIEYAASMQTEDGLELAVG